MRGRIAFIALFAALAAFLVLAAGLRSRHAPATRQLSARQVQSPPKLEQPGPQVEMPKRPEPVEEKKQVAALNDAALKSLIENARMAEQRGDQVTRDAMLAGLQKSPDRSKELISSEISRSNDASAAAALKTLMEKLQ